jgi:hypothetical protein
VINFLSVRRIRIIVIALLGFAALVGLTFFLVGTFKPKVAGIYVETEPVSTVYINNVQVGRTPYQAKRNPGELAIRLIPDSFDAPLAPFETRVDLVNGVETVVRRKFAENDDVASGEVISFEKLTGSDVGLAIVTLPDSAQVLVDGVNRGYAPFKTNSVDAGSHKVTVSAEGYESKTIGVQIFEGYQLTAVIKLAAQPQKEVEEEPVQEEEEKKTMVEILETSVGFLRVRNGPSTLDKEVGRAEPRNEYEFLEEDEDSGWYKIVLDEDTQGWVSNQYAELVEASKESAETPTPTQSEE